MKKALILAGGLGTRLKTYTKGQYPKLLLSLGNETMLDKLIWTWFVINGVEEMLIVVSEESYMNMIQKYLNVFHPDKPIKLCLYPKTDGTFKTIFYVLSKHKEYQSNVYLSWSDIVPNQFPEIENKTTFTIFTDKNKSHRYLAMPNGKINYAPAHNGNIMGLYYYDKLSPMDLLPFYNIVRQDDNEVDFVDYLMQVSPHHIKTYDVDVTDIGDVKKYESFLETQSVEQRWFNDIEFKKDEVIKSSVNAHGEEVMESEKDFYKLIAGTPAENAFPKIKYYTGSGFSMENLVSSGYETVHKILGKINGDPEQIQFIIDGYTRARKDLNGTIIPYQFNQAIFNEYYQVPIERHNKIEYLIPKNITSVNGIQIPSFYNVMDQLLNYLQSVDFDWGLIHGDTNSSNTMYNLTHGSIKFIDPRGIFGGEKYYGDVLYDQAKFMYGLSGYDNFNLDKNFKFDINGTDIQIYPGGIDLDEICDDKHIKILVGLIWLKLPFYIKNNPNKVIASYFYGMMLLTKYLK